MPNKRKIAVVEWIDASWDAETMRPEDVEPLARLLECGWLIREDKDSVTLAMEACDDDGRVRHTVSIPRAGIVRMKVVAVWGSGKKR